MDEKIVRLLTNILSDNSARSQIFGENNYLTLGGRSAAAKTGTTQYFNDAWTVGYTPSLVAGVWVGNNDNSAMRTGADGSIVAAPIWNQFMREALAETVWMVPERLWQRGLRPDCTPELYPPHPLVYRFDLGPRILLEKNRPFQKEDFHANGEVTLRYRGTLPVALGLVWKLGYSDVILCGIDLEGPYFYQDDPTWAGYFERLDREYPLRVQSWPLYPHEIGVGGTPRPMSEYLVAANEFVFKPANRRLWRGGSSRAQLPKWQWE